MTRTKKLLRPAWIIGHSATVGPKEGQGPMAKWFDNILKDDTMGEKTFEKAELLLFSTTADHALASAHVKPEELDLMCAGDLLDQIISSSFSARGLAVPFLGIYGACSTMAESLIVGSLAIAAQCAVKVLCLSGSHFSTAERQYRFPLELGSQRTPTAQRTVTAAGATVLASQGQGAAVRGFTVGKVIDYGITDANNMGAAMAPAAADTIATHLDEYGVEPDFYDYIITGDMGKLGKQLTEEFLQQRGYVLGSRYRDCGSEMFDDTQDAHCGASGCGCAASFLNGYYLKRMDYGEIKRILLVATGALLSPTSSQQGESIPGVAHAVSIEVE